jgi:LPXTG-motif cell wall-anchored protein
MSKVLGMLVALAIFAAVPAVAFGQDGDTVSSGNSQEGEIEQSASAGSGGNAGNQGAIVQQNAGRDANAAVNQSQNFSTGGANVHRGGGDFDNGHHRGVGGGHVSGTTVHGVGGGGGVGGGVGGVTLARTGFDAWILALIGGAALAGGIGLLALQRRGRLNA